MDKRIRTLAKNLVNYSCKVKPGDKVYVHYTGPSTKDLARQIIKEVYAVGGQPFPHYTDPKVQREMLLGCTEEQLKLMAEIDAAEMSKMDCYIGVRGGDNVSEYSDVPSEKMHLYENPCTRRPVHHQYPGAEDPVGSLTLSKRVHGATLRHPVPKPSRTSILTSATWTIRR